MPQYSIRSPKNSDVVLKANGQKINGQKINGVNGHKIAKLHLLETKLPSRHLDKQAARREVQEKIDSLRTAVQVHRDEQLKTAGFSEWLSGKVINILSKPVTLWAQTAVFAGWMTYNALSATKFDPYPFLFLSFLTNIASGYSTVVLCNSARKQNLEAEELGAAEADVHEQTLKLLVDIKELLEEQKYDGEVSRNRSRRVESQA